MAVLRFKAIIKGMSDKRRSWPLSRISTMHYIKLIFRSILFLVAAVAYIDSRRNITDDMFGGAGDHLVLLAGIWLIFAVEMILRFFPSKLESMGCEKQFSHNFYPASCSEGQTNKKHRHTKSVFAVAGIWLFLNAVIGTLYFTACIDQGMLLLISLLFSVCDMVCILFFCPFQIWIMKNKCCGSCRIYNWDYAMMFMPLIFFKNIYTWSLLALSLGLLLKWEITYRRHPERFSEATNNSLSCSSCQEKLCRHKKSLRRFLKRQRILSLTEINKRY